MKKLESRLLTIVLLISLILSIIPLPVGVIPATIEGGKEGITNELMNAISESYNEAIKDSIDSSQSEYSIDAPTSTQEIQNQGFAIRIPAFWFCSGYVTATAGAPLEGATVRVLDSNSNKITSTTTDSDGTYNVAVPDPYDHPGLVFTVEVSKTYFETLSVTKPKTGEYVQNFQPACTGRYWYGTIRDLNSQVIKNAFVEIFQAGTTIRIGSDTTDTKGRWGIATTSNWNPFSMVKITITKSGYITESIPDVLWWVGLVTKHDMTLLPNSWSCSGYVTATAGAPLEGATVKVLNGNSGTVTSTTTNSNGYYYLSVSNPNAQPGTVFTVQVSKSYFDTTSVTKPKGGSYTQDFQPVCNGRYWYGTVRDQNSQVI
ncbi:MAG: carboxypeptidase-like regulatory domain-containing protein, partial [Promethearchaeota archaeon]